jgi:hypothetical protein
VARALTQAGRRVHFTTVARWRAQSWKSSEIGQHPLDAARQALDAALPLLTDDPLTKAGDLVATNEAFEELNSLSDQELLCGAIRETSIALIVVMQEVQRYAPELVEARPAELGVLLTALGRCLKAKSLASEELVTLRSPASGEP